MLPRIPAPFLANEFILGNRKRNLRSTTVTVTKLGWGRGVLMGLREDYPWEYVSPARQKVSHRGEDPLHRSHRNNLGAD